MSCRNRVSSKPQSFTFLRLFSIIAYWSSYNYQQTRRAEIFPAKPAPPPSTTSKSFVVVAQPTTTKQPQTKQHPNPKQKGTNNGNQNLANSQRGGNEVVSPNHIAIENEIITGEGLIKGTLLNSWSIMVISACKCISSHRIKKSLTCTITHTSPFGFLHIWIKNNTHSQHCLTICAHILTKLWSFWIF